MPLKIIVEGPDMLGKTTFLESLKKMGVIKTVRKMGLPEATWTAADWLHWSEHGLIEDAADRSWISEVVYGLSCRGKCNIDVMTSRAIQRNLAARGYTTLVFMPASAVAYGHLMNTRYDAAREAFSKEQLIGVVRDYRRLLEDSLGEYRLSCSMRHYSYIVDESYSREEVLAGALRSIGRLTC